MKSILFFILAILVVSSCKGRNTQHFEFEGGTFKMAIDADLSTATPRFVNDYYSEIVLNQIFEGLVTLDPENLQVRPQIASAYKVSRDGLVYEFKIRKDVMFHPHALFEDESDRILSPADIVNTFELICSKNAAGNPSVGYAAIFENNVVGANEFYAGKTKKITGISAQKHTIKIQLIEPDAYFLNKLANINASITSKKLCDAKQENAMIGTGPFKYASTNNEGIKTIALVKNEDYYLQDAKGNQLPYLEALHFLVEPIKTNQLHLFETGKTDFILALPTAGISSILEGRIKDFNSVPPVLLLRSNPLLLTNYYFFNMKEPRFENIKVRQAFNYAINRAEITLKVMYNQVQNNGLYGIIPPLPEIFKNYDFAKVKAVSYNYDPEKAKQLLAEAGYKTGEEFGEVVLKINDGDIHTAVAETFAKQIFEVLGIQVKIEVEDFEQHSKDADYLKGDLFRTAWYADYNSPESFLHNFYGKVVPKTLEEPSTINQARYENFEFDRYFEKARSEKKASNQIGFFNLAEIELMKNPPLIVLWYGEDNQVVYSYIRGLKENPINYFNFKEVYIQQPSKEEYHQ